MIYICLKLHTYCVCVCFSEVTPLVIIRTLLSNKITNNKQEKPIQLLVG